MELTLYYSPGACSIAPHVALREADLAFQLARVDLRNRKLVDGGDWLAINPKGYVPALRLPTGEVLTEVAVLLQYIADQRPDAHLLPAFGTLAHYRQLEWLQFIATELHKGMSPLYNPVANDEFKAALKERLGTRFAAIAVALRKHPFLGGERFSAADAYAFYAMRSWQHAHRQDLARWPELVAYYARLAARPAVAAALEVEGLKA